MVAGGAARAIRGVCVIYTCRNTRTGFQVGELLLEPSQPIGAASECIVASHPQTTLYVLLPI